MMGRGSITAIRRSRTMVQERELSLRYVDVDEAFITGKTGAAVFGIPTPVAKGTFPAWARCCTTR